MHPELGQKLKHLEKLLSDTEKLAKRYLALTGKCPTELDDDDKVVIPFDDTLYTKLIKVYSEANSLFPKDEAAIDACLEKVIEMQKTGNLGGGYSGKNVNANMYGGVPSMNTVNPSAFNPSVLLGQTTNPSVGSKMDNKRRNKGDSESPAKKVKRNPKKGVPPSPSSPIPATYVAQVGDLAAARAPNSDQWILVRITGYNSKTGRYEVEDDAPDEEEPIAKKFICPSENLVLLPPDSASIPGNAQQPPNSIGTFGPTVYLWYPISGKTPVLAMFPQTTTFYPAKIISVHKQQKNKVVQYYQLQFDDDQEGGATPTRKVNAQYVIPLPKDF